MACPVHPVETSQGMALELRVRIMYKIKLILGVILGDLESLSISPWGQRAHSSNLGTQKKEHLHGEGSAHACVGT